MRCSRSLLLIVGTLLSLPGCGREYSGDKRFPLKGKVTFNGEIVDMGNISFIPLTEKQRVSGGSIVDGTYEVDEGRGANAGEYRVEVRWQKKTGKKVVAFRNDDGSVDEEDVRREGIPAEFNTNSKLTVTIDGEKSTYDFDLKADVKPAGNSDSGVPEIYRNR